MVSGFRDRFKVLILAFMVVTVGIAIGGCRKASEDDDAWLRELDIAQLKKAAAGQASESQEHAKQALSRLSNGVVDREPLVINAGLAYLDSGEVVLVIACFDEDRDLRGWYIEEHLRGADGTMTHLEERYPVFAATVATPLYQALMFPIELRRAGMRKDEEAWKDYRIWALEEALRSCTDSRQGDDPNNSAGEPLAMEMPPIIVSVPEPNRVRVLLSAYDRAGHRSEPYEIVVPAWQLELFKDAPHGDS